jgi:anti-sigma factor RsiW
MSACADKRLLVHALADGEIDAANALAIEAHLAACDGCRADYAHIRALRAALNAEPLGYTAPAGLRSGIAAMLADADGAIDDASPAVPAPRPNAPAIARHVLSWRWASGAITGLAAALVVMIALPHTPPARGDGDLVAGHVRSLMANHLTDVATSEKHVVKPWFNGRIDFAPPVPDLAGEGFPLAGGRLDLIEGREVAALVYRRRLHVINVFVAPVRASRSRAGDDETKDGYNIVRWTAGDLQFSAISDLNAKELRQFRQIFIAKAAG